MTTKMTKTMTLRPTITSIDPVAGEKRLN